MNTMEAPSGKPVKVLAVFEAGKPPRPCKYKITDRSGNEETIYIHKILWVDTRASLFVSYMCETYYGSTMRRYELRYWKQDFKWELYVK